METAVIDSSESVREQAGYNFKSGGTIARHLGKLRRE
jgi:hypothetical protein